MIDGIRKGKHLYMYVWATYHDVFRDTPLHVTEFCFEPTMFDADPYTGKGSGHTYFEQCSKHNCTDEDCRNENPPEEWLRANPKPN